MLLDGLLAFRRGAEDLPHDAAWAGIIEYIPGKDSVEAEELMRLLYPPPDMPSDDIFPNLAWWDSFDTVDANRTSCPTFPHVPDEHISEVTRLRIEIMRALVNAPD